MDDLLNIIRREAERAVRGLAQSRAATVTSYDPARHACKVSYGEVGEDGVESQWLPIAPTWAGNGWGVVCAPAIGTQVVVDYLGGGDGTGMVTGHLPNVKDAPPAVPSGEAWLVHSSGAFVKLLNGGAISISGGTINITGASEVNITAPTTTIHGDAVVTGDISDQNGAHGTFGTLRTAYNGHTHTDSRGDTTTSLHSPVP